VIDRNVQDDEKPFDVEAARDLLGIVRVAYRAKRSKGAGAAELERYAQVGRKLLRAIEISKERKLTSAACAQALANDAVVDLGNILDIPGLMATDLVNAAKDAIEAPRRRRRA
jgi:hypothetical protein